MEYQGEDGGERKDGGGGGERKDGGEGRTGGGKDGGDNGKDPRTFFLDLYF